MIHPVKPRRAHGLTHFQPRDSLDLTREKVQLHPQPVKYIYASPIYATAVALSKETEKRRRKGGRRRGTGRREGRQQNEIMQMTSAVFLLVG